MYASQSERLGKTSYGRHRRCQVRELGVPVIRGVPYTNLANIERRWGADSTFPHSYSEKLGSAEVESVALLEKGEGTWDKALGTEEVVSWLIL